MTNHYHETVYTDGTSYFAALTEAINHAKQSITLETYIFCNDSIGISIAQALARAAKRHVKIRVLVDGAGSFVMWSGNIKKILEDANIETRVFHPFPLAPRHKKQ